jgi:hypothetical protein
MSRRTLTLVLVLPLLLAGCNKPDHESVMKGMVQEMERMITVLASIQDEASSKAAAPQIRDITKNLQDYKKRADTMQRPSASEDKRLKEAYEPRLQKANADMMTQARRIASNPKLMTPELQSALQEMSTLKNK